MPSLSYRAHLRRIRLLRFIYWIGAAAIKLLEQCGITFPFVGQNLLARFFISHATFINGEQPTVHKFKV